LLAEALEAVRKGKSIHVIGKLMESTSLLESGYYLSIGDRDRVTHPSLLSIADWTEVETLKEHDPDLSVLWNQVEKYGSSIPHFVEELKEAGEAPAHKADVVISTVHKAKGMQWPEVKLSSLDYPKLIHYSEKERKHVVKKSEVYLYYVAITRAINVVYPNDIYYQLNDWRELL
jgi:superfamily I DNA/RNA helicase